jgi:hypothetical protein
MKKSIAIFSISLLMACNGSNKSNDFPGTYVRSSEHEFGKEYDTLVISEFMDQYKITRKWRYERVLDGVVQEPVYKVKVTTAYYEGKFRLLHENETGNKISIDKFEGILFVGPTKYKKI